jgi:hypothetical protein
MKKSSDFSHSKIWFAAVFFVLSVLSCSQLPEISKATPKATSISSKVYLPALVLKPKSVNSPPAEVADSTEAVQSPTRESFNPNPTTIRNPTQTAILLDAASPTATQILTARFAVIGDYGLAGEPERDVAKMITEWGPDFIITTGDNNYPDGTAETIDENIGQYFHAYIYPYSGNYGEGADINRFFPTLGNHDWYTDGAQPYFDYFTLPGNERYYDFVWGPVHFFAIDSDSREPDGVGSSSIQAEWLRGKLTASISPWKIVYMHHPPYASAGDGSITWARWPYKEWGATAVFSGHSHVYERILVDGFPYFVNGLGGGPRYAFEAPVPGSQFRYNDDYGVMFVEATSKRIEFQFVSRENHVVDHFSLEK